MSYLKGVQMEGVALGRCNVENADLREDLEHMMNLKPVLNPESRIVKETDHAYIYDYTSARVQVVNKTALFILELCDKSHSVEEIIEKLSATFPHVSEPKLEKDVVTFIADLIERGVVTF
jgi:hypothetical protein